MWKRIINRRLTKKARQCARAGNWKGASDLYKEILDNSTGSYKIAVQYAHSLKEQGRPQFALEAYRAAIELNPLEADAYKYAADLEVKYGDVEKAKIWYIRSLIADPACNSLSQRLSDLTETQFEIELLFSQENINNFQKISAASGKSIFLYRLIRNLARSYARKQFWEKALKYYLISSKLISKFDWSERHKILKQMGHCAKELNNLKQSEQYYRESISFNPLDVELYTYINDLSNNNDILIIRDYLNSSASISLEDFSRYIANNILRLRHVKKGENRNDILIQSPIQSEFRTAEGVANKGRQDIIFADLTRQFLQGKR